MRAYACALAILAFNPNVSLAEGRGPAITIESQERLKAGQADRPGPPDKPTKEVHTPEERRPTPSTADMRKLDNDAIQAANEQLASEERINRQIDAIVEAVKAHPSETGQMKAEEAARAVLDMKGWCSACEMERRADAEYYTKLVTEAAKKIQEQRDAASKAVDAQKQ